MSVGKSVRREWAIRLQGTDGGQLYGPFAKVSSAVAWALKAEQERGHLVVWSIVRLVEPR